MTRFVAAVLLLWITAQLSFADGGALILHQRAGSVSVSIFASPAPLRSGMADFSVLLQDAESDDVLLDGTVQLELNKSGQAAIRVEATPGHATNKLLYAATLQVPESGEWTLTAVCRRGGNDAVVRGTVSVLPAEPAILSYWFYFAMVPLAIFLFVLNQQLKSKRRVARLPARP